jgi:hypothetical protein
MRYTLVSLLAKGRGAKTQTGNRETGVAEFRKFIDDTLGESKGYLEGSFGHSRRGLSSAANGPLNRVKAPCILVADDPTDARHCEMRPQHEHILIGTILNEGLARYLCSRSIGIEVRAKACVRQSDWVMHDITSNDGLFPYGMDRHTDMARRVAGGRKKRDFVSYPMVGFYEFMKSGLNNRQYGVTDYDIGFH